MRILLFTGKGGVGKSTLAAATAARAARSGRRTLVLSTDAAHSLADALGHEAGPDPVEVSPGLWVQHVDAQRRFEQSWAEIQRYLLTVLDKVGVDPIAAEELTVIPGAEEVLALLEVREQARSGAWDVLVVDCAPTAETLRLLALPEALGWYIERVLPAERRVVKVLRPVLDRTAGVPMPTDSVFDALERLHGELQEVHELLTGSDASIRLVLTPEQVVLAEARHAYTLLSLFGYRVDAAVVNRIFPADGADAWRSRWVDAQRRVMQDVEDSFTGLPVWSSSYREQEPVGMAELLAMADTVYADEDELADHATSAALQITRDDTATVLNLSLPLATSDDVRLARKGEELVVSVGPYRRLIGLPAGLSRHSVQGARVRDGRLQVRFVEEAGKPHE